MKWGLLKRNYEHEGVETNFFTKLISVKNILIWLYNRRICRFSLTWEDKDGDFSVRINVV